MKILITTTALLLLLFALSPGENDNEVSTGGSGEVTAGDAAQIARNGEQVKWQVVAAGGAKGTSTNYILSGTAGQTAVGPGSSTGYKVLQGYWQNFVIGPSYTCGDASGDATVDISDVVYLIAYLYKGGPPPPC